MGGYRGGPLMRLVLGNFSGPADAVLSFFSVFVLVLLCFPVRNCAKILMAKYLGDDTAERSGQLTLNPFVHVDLMGFMMMMLFCIGWSKPVDIYPSRCGRASVKKATALISAAGPVSMIIMAYIFLIITKLTAGLANENNSEVVYYAVIALYYVAFINVFLAVLNLLPIPGFDGFNIILPLMKPSTQFRILQKQQLISSAFMIIFFFTPIISNLLSFISDGIITALDFLSIFLGRVT
ncbi:metalloprotease [Clostridia bacterium]|nr:metalloprotease [Clostridia bacterium]